MKIPKRFQLMGQTIEVVTNDSIMHESDALGLANYRSNRIELFPLSKSNPLTREKYEQVFCHELVHWLLYFGGHTINDQLETPAHLNEALVDTLGHLLHQALNTMEYR